MKLVISSGHGKYVAGAEDVLIEVEEARRVVDRTADYLEDAGVEVVVFHDDTSHDQETNLDTIVEAHNEAFGGAGHDWDLSVHFNSSNGRTDKAIGTETWHKTQETKGTAAEVTTGIARVSGLIDRGPKQTDTLQFLNSTKEKALLLEIAFANSTADASLYEESFDDICRAIAETISGQSIGEAPPTEAELPYRPESIPVEDRPTLRRGDDGQHVLDMQRMIPRFIGDFDGDFGPTTEENVMRYQRTRLLGADGICGQQTWQALYDHKLPTLPTPPPGVLTAEQQAVIKAIALGSEIASYDWDDRGEAPAGFIQGMALTFAQTYKKLYADHPAAIEMAKARTSSDKDVFNVYRSQFDQLGMSNERSGIDTLRHLYAFMLGSGMRESAGEHCTGRDQSAENVDSDTCEAGAFQTSYNASNATDPEFDDLMDEYLRGDSPGYLEAWSEDVSCSDTDWECYGSGRGAEFQELCKNLPAFSAETHALTLRNLANHYGPVIREEVELKAEADQMFKKVQDYMDTQSHEVIGAE
jgi:peptidoglycan hydrolase-like protein with peptidoglycan-binding domain